jgi:hypothetical protein
MGIAKFYIGARAGLVRGPRVTPEAFRRVNPEMRGNLIVAGTYIQIPGQP